MNQNLGFLVKSDMVARIARDELIPKQARLLIVDYCKVLVELGYTGDVVIGTTEPVTTPDEVTHEGDTQVSPG